MLNYQRVHSTHNFVFMIWARSQEPYPQWYGAPLPQEPPRHWTAYVLPIAYLTRGLPLIVDTYRLYTQRKHILIPFDSYIVLNTTWPYAWMQYVPTYMHTYTHIYIYIHTYIHKSPIDITNLCVVYTLPHHYLYIYIYSLHPTYTTYTCFIACPYTTLCIACPYTIIRYLPKYSPYTPYKLKIKHLQLHKHCPCRTVVVGTPPRPQGGGG